MYSYRNTGDFFGLDCWINQCDGKWGYIDKRGQEVIPLKYSGASHFSKEGVAAVRSEGKIGLINLSGDKITEFKYDRIDLFGHWSSFFQEMVYIADGYGLGRVSWSDKENTYEGYVNSEGKEIWVNATPLPKKYIVSIRCLTQVRIFLPLYASLNTIEITRGTNTQIITVTDIIRNNLPSFVSMKSPNEMELSLEGDWMVLAQLSRNGIIEVTVKDSKGNAEILQLPFYLNILYPKG